jgi:hypothetical protein
MLCPRSWCCCCCCCCSPPVVFPLSPHGCWVVVSLVASIDPHRPIAPPIHPASSCSQRWRWVLGRVLVVVVNPPCEQWLAGAGRRWGWGWVARPRRSRCCCCCCCCWCSCPVVPAVVVSPCCCCCPCRPPRSSSFPPLAPTIRPASSCSQRQGRVLGRGHVSLGAGAGAMSLIPFVVDRLHPPSIQRAVAHWHGGGGRVVSVTWRVQEGGGAYLVGLR